MRWPERRQGQAASQADRVGGREEGRVYYYIGERLKLEGETTENRSVCTKEQEGMTRERTVGGMMMMMMFTTIFAGD